ncbi:cuticle protein 19-like [Ostrinia nubilalis]|uniref:cuticle protein 19-like n=1 Tax=Ostrinia nubilalis TaxID=29057 RepID=UPI0030822B0C
MNCNMYSKIVILSVLVAVCHAGIIVDDGRTHAISSQSLHQHDQPTHHVTAHFTPVVQHQNILEHAPTLLHQTSFLDHGPVVHATPLVHHVTPVVQHVAQPVVQHVAPAVHAPLVQHVSPVAVAVGRADQEEHAPVKYEFSYSVEDPTTGDHKSHRESRDGDLVRGEYSLLQPDGSIRKVEYTADDHSGFNAVVSNSAPTHAAQEAHAPVHATPYHH